MRACGNNAAAAGLDLRSPRGAGKTTLARWLADHGPWHRFYSSISRFARDFEVSPTGKRCPRFAVRFLSLFGVA